MVRKYIRKSQRKSWSADAMRLAIEAVIKQGSSIRRASIEHEVPQATLSRKIHQCRCEPEKDIDLIANPHGSNYQTVFTKEQEMILCKYITTLENQFVPLNGMDIRRLAFQVAEKFNIPHRFNKDTAVAGEDWYRGFLKRNSEVSVKKFEYSAEKVKGIRKEKVYKFFDLLESIVKKHQLEASDIYNLDETVITCLSKLDSKATPSVEKTESEGLDSEGQSKLVTAVVSFSASGAYVPLVLIFPRKSKCKLLLNGAPPGAWAEFDPTGQMQLEIFIKWLKKFIKFSKATKDSPVLLIVDNYRSYLKNLKVLELAEENGVNILCLPLYCTQKLQPMHQIFMKSLSTAYNNEVTKWSRANPGCSVSAGEIYQLFGKAFMKVSTIATPVNSFRTTGIWPAEKDLYEEDFIDTTKEVISSNENSSESNSQLFKSAVEEACPEIIPSNAPVNNMPLTVIPNNVVHEPIVVITQGHRQPYVAQSLGNINQQNGQFVQQTYTQQPFVQQQLVPQYQVVKQGDMESMQLEQNVILENQGITNGCEDVKVCSVVIPPEAQLSEVRVEDLQSLIQCQRKLHFYVSPYRLNLSS